MSIEKTINVIQILFSGIGTSIRIFLLTLVLSIPLSIIVALCRNSKFKILAGITKLYILLIRGTPIILQIIFVYFAPYYLFKITYLYLVIIL